MAATAGELRRRFNLPEQAPAATLDEHLASATRRLARDAGMEAAPDGLGAEWDEAVLWAALATCAPFLHLFAMSGAGAAARLAEGVDMRFLTPEEISALTARAEAEYGRLLSVLAPARAGASVRAGGLAFVAI